jgi:hypothetical protein
MPAEHLDHHLFPGGRALRQRLALRLLPRVLSAGWYAQHLAEQPDGVMGVLRLE